MYFDIHTHKELIQDENVRSILNLNVPQLVCCGLNLQRVYYSLGIHPWKIEEDNLSKQIDYIEKNGIFESVKMLGECGLDKQCDTPWNLQLKAFVAILCSFCLIIDLLVLGFWPNHFGIHQAKSPVPLNREIN